jgi:hypothetical protein
MSALMTFMGRHKEQEYKVPGFSSYKYKLQAA